MKAFLRSTVVQQTVATLFAAWLKFCYATTRWTVEGLPMAETVWAREGGAILCLWHAQISLGPYCWPQGPDRQDMRVLISKSADGELIALTVQKIGFPAIRGSSKKASDTSKNKNGEQALREMAKWVRDGGGVAITPDGPRGPAEVMQRGALTVARITGAPAIFCGLATSRCLRAGSWDRTVLPLPFARGAIVWEGPAFAEKGDDMDALTTQWAARLTAVQRRAEALVDGAGAQ